MSIKLNKVYKRHIKAKTSTIANQILLTSLWNYNAREK